MQDNNPKLPSTRFVTDDIERPSRSRARKSSIDPAESESKLVDDALDRPNKPTKLNLETTNRILSLPSPDNQSSVKRAATSATMAVRKRDTNNQLSVGASATRAKSLSRPERAASRRFGQGPRAPDDKPQNLLASTPESKYDPWIMFSKAVTCCFPDSVLRKWGKMDNAMVRQAWREKIALCTIIAVMCGVLGFLTFGMTRAICPKSKSVNRDIFLRGGSPSSNTQVIIYGRIYEAKNPEISEAFSRTDVDVTSLFYLPSSFCSAFTQVSAPTSCQLSGSTSTKCLNSIPDLGKSVQQVGEALISWDTIEAAGSNYIAFNGDVIDLTQYLAGKKIFGDEFDAIIRKNIGKDVSRPLNFADTSDVKTNLLAANCLSSLYRVGSTNDTSSGCLVSQVFLYFSLIIILGVILTRFILALLFSYFISRQLGKFEKEKRSEHSPPKQPRKKLGSPIRNHLPNPLVVDKYPISQYGLPKPSSSPQSKESSLYESAYSKEVHTVMLVTCYSEGADGLKTTMDSLANTTYDDDFKLLFIVSDGIITGSGNEKPTPQLVLDMLDVDPGLPFPPEPKSYIAVAEGSKRHNMAQVYTAWYNHNGHNVPTILVVKCGTPEELNTAKPGNRGKRDSQIILMNFFQRVMLDEPMSPLDYELFEKIRYLMGVTADAFEVILMVDADTKVEENSLSKMVACMVKDNQIMGLCGETRIANKSESWVSRIQVFEYYLSHHLNKAFESIFGGVTCLPGCFCMYRIKAPKGDGFWIPILCNPDVVTTYSQSNVDTLHKKNLLLLGEDRFLTSIMLRSFPSRKMMFVPEAYCKTMVPTKLSVLMSQRRRWINSTIHNLMELALVRELCGTFCFSMQAVVILELIGCLYIFYHYLSGISFSPFMHSGISMIFHGEQQDK